MKHKWLFVWLLQIVEMLAIGVLQALSAGVHPAVYGVMLWGVVPLAGFWTALRAVRRGLLNYVALLAPPICQYAANVLIWPAIPPVGAVLLTGALALIGSATGEVMNHRGGSRRR